MTFEEYVAARLPALLRYAVMLTGDPHVAEDVVQDTMIRAYFRWRRVQRADHPDRYVKRMVTNAYLMWRRGTWVRRAVPYAEPPDVPVGDTSESSALRQEMWDQLDQASPEAAGRRRAAVLRGPAGHGDRRDSRLRRRYGPVPDLAGPRIAAAGRHAERGGVMIDHELRQMFAEREAIVLPVAPLASRITARAARRDRRVRIQWIVTAVVAVVLLSAAVPMALAGWRGASPVPPGQSARPPISSPTPAAGSLVPAAEVDVSIPVSPGWLPDPLRDPTSARATMNDGLRSVAYEASPKVAG